MINITDEDIKFAESVLLKENQNFDTERVVFIKNLNTIDLQAVPGSGKTTALLAKLLILERYMPLKEGRGILVISHTNAAVDEIRDRIGKYCPKLFSYPNFVGTIQSFVDVFLAIPYYTNRFKQKPYRIDNEIYFESIEKAFTRNFSGFTRQEQKNARYFIKSNKILSTYRLKRNNNSFQLISSINGNELIIKKPRSRNWIDFSEPEKQKIKDWLVKLKLGIIHNGILHFDDAYLLAELQLEKISGYARLLQKRFFYVFVDEMQDMDTHQHDLIEKVFYSEGNSESIVQRIGDKNQAIFNGGSVHLDTIWTPRENVLYINGSHRLSKKIAALVQNLALTPNPIEGRNQNLDGSEIDINPTIYIYQDDTKTQVISAFADRIKALQDTGRIPLDSSNKFMAIAWRKEHDDVDKIALSDYWPNFSSSSCYKQIDFKVLEDYILFYDKEKRTLESVRKNILNAFLKILRIENIYDEQSRVFTKRKLINFFKSLENDEYEILKLNLYKWSLDSIKGNTIESISSIREYIPTLLSIFQKTIDLSTVFINGVSDIIEAGLSIESQSNLFEAEDITIEIGTIHSAKGQTHTATLYLETYFQKDGNGANAKSYESQRLAEQILGNQLLANVGTRVKQSAKMAYVGFSRPTHLLCLAVHKDRFDLVLSGISRDIWEIIEVEPAP